MELPPVSYAPRTRQRPLPVILPIMAGLGIGVSTLFTLWWAYRAIVLFRVVGQDTQGTISFLSMLVLAASHVFLALTSRSLLAYHAVAASKLRQRVWWSVGGLTLTLLVAVVFTLIDGWRIAGPSLLIFGYLYAIQLILPAFLITVLRQPLVTQAYEREARRRAALGELESGA